ncbi:hypothetical protein FEE95_06310 [Maribacter algarum]|uniref:Uncharacterized protein n=1 Tax=Maribacter algarum (ex Zhang et al. 2020) TaxID=2578118 RepID=A0A5S3PVR0_9FLAO|nr:hypothetical protein [Maribacter algarum]TMM59043.1 hypothetical protein FEE95_06310 [Maribacter algarum]
MKKKTIFKMLFIPLVTLATISCDDTEGELVAPLPNPELLTDFWFGYYQEDPLTNPEDPLAGFIYLKIPDSGNFEGELYFSYSGCEGGVDIGRVTGTASNGNLDGTWSGNADGKNVGGDYLGQLVGDEMYQGTYINDAGKVEIVCDEDFSYYVASNGTWTLQKTGNNEELNATVNKDSDPIALNWDAGNGSGLTYSVVFIDAECLEQNLDLEECLMWSGISTSNSIIYGEGIGETIPAQRLVSGNSYIASITCINTSGEVTASSNITFVR